MSTSPVRMRDAFLDAVQARMREDKRVFLLTADFGSPVLDGIIRDFPDRFVNVGIAEQNLINVGTGLALEGFKVVAYAIAPFISMRCYEQVRVNLAILSQLRPLNVTLASVGAGMSYDVSGPTHQALEDLSVMRTLPNLDIFSVSDGALARLLAADCLTRDGVKYLRLDGRALPPLYETGPHNVDLAKGFCELRVGRDVCLVGTGYMTHKSLEASRQFPDGEAGVVDFFSLSRFDHRSLAAVLKRYRTIITVEEGFAERGGLDACVASLLREQRIPARLVPMGLPPTYCFSVGPRDGLLDDLHLGVKDIAARIRESAG